MTRINLRLLADKMLSPVPEIRQETFLILNNEMDNHEGFEEIILQVVGSLICCNRVIQADVLNELPILLGSDSCKPLISFLTSPFSEIRSLATLLLAHHPLGQEEIGLVCDLLCHDDQDIRNRAVEVLVADGQDELVFTQLL